MSRKKRQTRYTILLVCEGTVTEPAYFNGLRQEVYKQDIWSDGVYITIKPEPPEDEDNNEHPPSKHKSKRKKRALKQGGASNVIEEVESKFKSVPLRYVRLAQKGLEDNTFEEAWAIYDHDGHPSHKAAFDLANEEVEGKRVGLAFTNRSFEHWVLLHFEKNNYPFPKTECKSSSRQSLNCGTGDSEMDCYGEQCIGGFIRHKEYNSFKKNNLNLYTALRPKLENALQNAAWLRNKQDCNLESAIKNNVNPYTNMDKLIKHLLKLDKDYQWISWAKEIPLINGVNVVFNLLENNVVNVNIVNSSNKSIIVGQNSFKLIIDHKKVPIPTKRTIISPQAKATILLKIPPKAQTNVLEIELLNTILLLEIAKQG